MSDVASIKNNLTRAPWRVHKSLTVQGAEGPVELQIRRPPQGAVLAMLEEAKKDGLIDEEGKPTSPTAGLRFIARVVTLSLFLPNQTEPLFTEAEALAWPGLDDVRDACQEALMPAGALAEKLKGK